VLLPNARFVPVYKRPVSTKQSHVHAIVRGLDMLIRELMSIFPMMNILAQMATLAA